jgi:hypothetical protein
LVDFISDEQTKENDGYSPTRDSLRSFFFIRYEKQQADSCFYCGENIIFSPIKTTNFQENKKYKPYTEEKTLTIFSTLCSSYQKNIYLCRNYWNFLCKVKIVLL